MTVPIFHTYEMWEQRLPSLGDKALCGHVKRTDQPPLWWLGQPCVVCLDLEKYRDWIMDEADEECAW